MEQATNIEEQITLLGRELKLAKARFERWLVVCCLSKMGISRTKNQPEIIPNGIIGKNLKKFEKYGSVQPLQMGHVLAPPPPLDPGPPAQGLVPKNLNVR
jgi:hypothetical protein